MLKILSLARLCQGNLQQSDDERSHAARCNDVARFMIHSGNVAMCLVFTEDEEAMNDMSQGWKIIASKKTRFSGFYRPI